MPGPDRAVPLFTAALLLPRRRSWSGCSIARSSGARAPPSGAGSTRPAGRAVPELACRTSWPAVLALSLNAYVLIGGADFGGGVWDLLASGPRRDAPARAHRARHRPDLGGEPRLADPRHRAALHLLPAGVRPARHRAAHPAHADAGRHRAARLGVHLPHLRQPARRGPAALGPHLRRRQRHHSGPAGGVDRRGRLGPGRPGPAAGGFVDAVRRRRGSRPSPSASGCWRWRSSPSWPRSSSRWRPDDPELREDFRRRALGVGRGGLLRLGPGAAALARRRRRWCGPGCWPRPGRSRCTSPPASPPSRCWRRSGSGATVWRGSAVGLQVSLIFWGWALAQYPYLVPPDLTIEARRPRPRRCGWC